MFKNNLDFYPTPKNLIYKMLSDIDFRKISSVLEPSAGKGDIVDVLIEKFKSAKGYYNSKENFDIDCVEIDQHLQHILAGKGYRVVHDDFLTYNSFKKYDLIIMNPPFSDGEKHVLKALEMQSRTGGQLVALLNAETINNAFSNSRKDLLRKLEEYNADIEFIQDAFVDAERRTRVEVALIKMNIEKPEYNSIILEELRQQEQLRGKATYNSSNNLINADFIEGIVQQYNFEVKAGLNLIAEYEALKPFMLDRFKKDGYSNHILELKLHYNDNSNTLENAYIRQIRSKYWKALFTSDQFMGKFTTNLRYRYMEKVNELRDYDFSLFNIYTIRIQLNKELIKGVEETIMELFEEFSSRHSMEYSKNIHYYSGWKTNKCWKVSKRVILPLNAYSWSGKLNYEYGNINQKLSDIEKVFLYLDANNEGNDIDLQEVLKESEKKRETNKIETKYFKFSTYKKGTTHIEFTNLDLLHKFNLFGAQRKNWLPPSYGKAKYKDMTQEEKQVIDNFEGETSYNKVMSNRDYYIVDTSNLLMLAQ